MFTAILGLSVVLGLTGCTSQEGLADRTTLEPSAEDAGRFLAGLPGKPDGEFASLERTRAWQNYASRLDEAWGELEQHRFQPARAFQRRELPATANTSILFYPFSGPDVLYPRIFFPNCRVVVMAGLEPVGSLHAVQEYGEGNIETELRGWSHALSSLFRRSFFVTGEMDREFRGRVADGLVPMILLLLARSGHRIDRMVYGHLTPSGEFVAERNPTGGADKVPGAGVEIDFHGEHDAVRRTLYYFSTDLAAGFGRDSRLAQFVLPFGPSDTLIKSASFLPHWRMCDAVRDFILRNSNLILQDDTGVKYRQLEALKWHVQLFGEYSHPDRPFQREYQPDLAKAFYDRAKVRPLGFSLGYGAGRRPSSLMLAVRTAATLSPK
jgi:hypothetical protein